MPLNTPTNKYITGLNLPDSASIATPTSDGRMHAPSAARNATAICDLVAHFAPDHGAALEIASGTGEHIVQLAARLPGMMWHPTDIDPARQQSIDAWAKSANLINIAPVQNLDATAPGWSKSGAKYDLIQTTNLLHLVSEPGAKTLIKEAAKSLLPGGVLILYGPFLRAGETTSTGDATFHNDLRSHDPEIGYKDDFDVIDWLQNAQLSLVDVVEMPANNLAFVATRAQ